MNENMVALNNNQLIAMVNNMNTEELAKLSDVVMNNRLAKMENTVYDLAQQVGTIQANFNIINSKVLEVNEKLQVETDRNSAQDVLLDTLEYKDNGYLKKQLARICHARVSEIFSKHENSPEYALFYYYVRRNISSWVSEQLKVGRIGQIKTSDYSKACTIAKTYYPTSCYLQKSFDNLTIKIKSGQITGNRLFSYLTYTNPHYTPVIFRKYECSCLD